MKLHEWQAMMKDKKKQASAVPVGRMGFAGLQFTVKEISSLAQLGRERMAGFGEEEKPVRWFAIAPESEAQDVT